MDNLYDIAKVICGLFRNYFILMDGTLMGSGLGISSVYGTIKKLALLPEDVINVYPEGDNLVICYPDAYQTTEILDEKFVLHPKCFF